MFNSCYPIKVIKINRTSKYAILIKIYLYYLCIRVIARLYKRHIIYTIYIIYMYFVYLSLPNYYALYTKYKFSFIFYINNGSYGIIQLHLWYSTHSYSLNGSTYSTNSAFPARMPL